MSRSRRGSRQVRYYVSHELSTSQKYSKRSSARNFCELCAQVAAMSDILSTLFLLEHGFHTIIHSTLKAKSLCKLTDIVTK